MAVRNRLLKIEPYVSAFAKLNGLISLCAFLLGLISQFFRWGQSWFFHWLSANLFGLWLWLITASVVLFGIWTYRLYRRFVSGFTDNFKSDLATNWDFTGQWRVPKPGILLITDSDPGGITKIGAQWENYTFSFTAKIISQCIGVIVRAQDLNNYYMIQIRQDKIRPHRRVTYPVVQKTDEKDGQQKADYDQQIKFETGWYVFDPPIPITPALNDWFDVRIVVRGQSIALYINEQLLFHRESFLQIAIGKVGFRNHSAEEAHVKNVKVTLQP